MFKTPILIILFNRPECSQQVLRVLQHIKPAEIYIAADGPRTNNINDFTQCTKTRAVFGNIDWNCKVNRHYQESNLGCKLGVIEAINWFFESVDMGIILEDDIVPDLSFFPYCEELLLKYENDSRIMMISGHNPIDTWNNGFSYVFSKIGAIWGWATWKRAWKLNDFNLTFWPEIKTTNILENSFLTLPQYNYRKQTIDLVYEQKIDTWDYQWTYSRLINSGLSIVPCKNLIKNIGFGFDATHTKNADSIFIFQNSLPMIFPVKHPYYILPDYKFDFSVYENTVKGKSQNILLQIIKKAKNIFK